MACRALKAQWVAQQQDRQPEVQAEPFGGQEELEPEGEAVPLAPPRPWRRVVAKTPAADVQMRQDVEMDVDEAERAAKRLRLIGALEFDNNDERRSISHRGKRA